MLLVHAAAPTRAGEPAPPREARPLAAGIYVERGFEYAARPRPEDQREAERLFRKALALAADDYRPHAGLARVSVYLYGLGEDETPARLQTALESATRAVDLAPEEGRARASLALALAAANRLARAEEEARRAVALAPGSAETHLVLSQVLRLRGRYDEALATARAAADLDPSEPRALVALGDALRDLDRPGEALEIYGQAVDLDHEAIVPQLAAAGALLKDARLSRARGALNLLLERWDYGINRTLLGAAALLVALTDYEGALEMYERVAIADNASHPTLLALYGKAWCLLRLDRDAEAEYFLTTLVSRVPADWDGPVRARVLLFLAYDDLVRFFDKRGHSDRVEALLASAASRPLAPTRFARALAARLHGRRALREGTALLDRALRAAEPGEDAIEISETALLLARLATRGGTRRLAADGSALAALRMAGERIAPSPLGAAHYRFARAMALAGLDEAALDSLRRAREGGYLPPDQAASEPDLERLRRHPAFRRLLHDAAPPAGE